MSRVTERTVKNATTEAVISTETFTYDEAGNITGDSVNITFVYDTNNRLVNYNGNSVFYDADGNMLSNGAQSFTYDSANRLITAGGSYNFAELGAPVFAGVDIQFLPSSDNKKIYLGQTITRGISSSSGGEFHLTGEKHILRSPSTFLKFYTSLWESDERIFVMLKKIFLIISAISFCLLLISQMLSINVNAIQKPLSVREVTGEECEKILNNMQFTAVHSETEIEFFPIVCFDVRDDGLVAIGAKKHLTNEGIICVYKDGIFQYGYSFNVGSKFDIRWSNELINIRTDRSSLVLSINREGQVVRVLEDLQGQVNFDQRKKVVNGEMYFMQNNFENELFNVMGFIGSSYAQFCVTNAAGETTVLYDVSAKMLSRMTIAVVAFGSFFVIAILNLIIQGVRRRKKEKRFGY